MQADKPNRPKQHFSQEVRRKTFLPHRGLLKRQTTAQGIPQIKSPILGQPSLIRGGHPTKRSHGLPLQGFIGNDRRTRNVCLTMWYTRSKERNEKMGGGRQHGHRKHQTCTKNKTCCCDRTLCEGFFIHSASIIARVCFADPCEVQHPLQDECSKPRSHVKTNNATREECRRHGWSPITETHTRREREREMRGTNGVYHQKG